MHRIHRLTNGILQVPKVFKYFAASLIVTVISAYYMTSGTNQTPKYKYLALGDSYTIGESVENSGRFPMQLHRMLVSDSIDIAEPLIITKTGWTTDELMAAITERNVKDTFDIVTLLIGVNNQYRGRSSEQYRSEFKQLLDTAIMYAGGKTERVFVLSIPDWGVTPFAEGRDRKQIAKEIDGYNFVNKSEAMNAGVKYFDITDISRMSDAMLVASDGLHPSALQYKKWVERIYPEIKKVFTN
jgi:lysophospholipase L1-like esterase